MAKRSARKTRKKRNSTEARATAIRTVDCQAANRRQAPDKCQTSSGECGSKLHRKMVRGQCRGMMHIDCIGRGQEMRPLRVSLNH